MPDALLNMPEVEGVYWYFDDSINDFRICDVVKKDGEMRAKFSNGSFQRWVGKKSYFVGPITKPVIGESGTIHT
jgi:hypothetical protein